MEVSKYNLFVPDFPEAGKVLLYNTLSQALIVIDKEVFDALKEQDLRSLSSGVRDILAKQGVLTKAPVKAKEVLERIYRDAVKAGFEVTVLTTLDCNFNCVYCFEGNRKGSLYMSQEIARALLSWLKGLITERGYKRVFIVFYGGEPLLNKAIIDFIISEINNGKLPVRPRYCLITNGSLLNREDIIRWANMGLDEVRVTLDGPKEIHDARRPFKGGKGSYDVIVKNVEAILGLVGVSITVNFDKSTIGGVKGLIDEMAGRGWPSRIKSLLVGPVVPEIGMRATSLAEDWTVSLFSPEGLFQKLLALIDYGRAKGFRMRIPLGMNTCPLLMRDGGAFIDPEGKIYKCASFVGEASFQMGTVFNGWDEKKMEWISNLRPWNYCPEDCVFLPLCQGGCRLFSYVLGKDLGEPFCQRDFLERNLPELLKREYLWRRCSSN